MVLLCVLYSHRIWICTRLVVMVNWKMLALLWREVVILIGRVG